VRHLDAASDLRGRFDTVICLECIEHILDDAKLMRDMAACLKPGGRLLLTSPNADYIPITPGDAGPFWPVETGWHVRKGYTAARLHEFCAGVGLTPRHVTFCSGFLSQKLTWGLRTLGRRNHLLGWAAILPLRWIPPLIDGVVSRLTNWPGYSICLEADKPPGAPPP
jgi:SAM-dependent methyltransferase